MSHVEDRFHSRDGLELHEHRWLPRLPADAAVVVVHGINEHAGRYARVAEALNEHGYAVYAMDLRGHGRSTGPRALVYSFDEYLADLDVLLARVREREPEKPLFLFGHSMGGAIAARFVVARQPQHLGLILSAPAVRIGANVFPVLRHLAGIVGLLFPRLRLVRLGCRYISRDPQVIEDFKNDPLVFHGRFPVRTGAEIFRAAKRVEAEAAALTSPLLILHGTADAACDVEGSRVLHLRAGSRDKTLHLYEGLYHEVLSEPERERVLCDMIAWMNRRRTTEL
jgi:alpha-beta hydrolase superfamily lysophospholipase